MRESTPTPGIHQSVGRKVFQPDMSVLHGMARTDSPVSENYQTSGPSKLKIGFDEVAKSDNGAGWSIRTPKRSPGKALRGGTATRSDSRLIEKPSRYPIFTTLPPNHPAGTSVLRLGPFRLSAHISVPVRDRAVRRGCRTSFLR